MYTICNAPFVGTRCVVCALIHVSSAPYQVCVTRCYTWHTHLRITLVGMCLYSPGVQRYTSVFCTGFGGMQITSNGMCTLLSSTLYAIHMVQVCVVIIAPTGSAYTRSRTCPAARVRYQRCEDVSMFGCVGGLSRLQSKRRVQAGLGSREYKNYGKKTRWLLSWLCKMSTVSKLIDSK